MQTNRAAQFACVEINRTVPIVQRVEWVSGIGDDQPQPIVLAEACRLASRCPKAESCPLDS